MAVKEKVVGKVGRPQVDPDHYFGSQYDSKERFASYWHQVQEVLRLKPQSVLEIGVGNGFLSRYLRSHGVKVTTMDIDEKLGPDVVGSVTDIPFEENSFELITCFEVLEHLPYSKSLKALGEMRRVSRDSVAISIPDWGHIFWVEIKMPFWGKCEWRIEFDRIVPLKDPRTEAEHFWELGVQDYSLDRLKKDLKEIGYKLGHTYKVKEMPSHRFIKLSIKT